MSVPTMPEGRRVTRTRTRTCRATTCVRSLGKGTELSRKQARKDQTDVGRGIVGKELMNGRVPEEMEEGEGVRRAPRAANLTGTVTRTQEALEREAKAGTGKSENPMLLRLPRARAHRSELSV